MQGTANFMIDIKTIVRSISFAFQGLFYVLRTQNNARFHSFATLIVVGLGIWLQLNFLQWCIIIIAIGMVWVTECFNTSIEKLFDLVNPASNPLVKYGKDAGAAAVLISAFLGILLGILVMGPLLYLRILSLFK